MKGAETLIMEYRHKDNWENVENDLHPVDQTAEIVQLHPHNLKPLKKQTTYGNENNNSSSEIQTTNGTCT